MSRNEKALGDQTRGLKKNGQRPSFTHSIFIVACSLLVNPLPTISGCCPKHSLDCEGKGPASINQA